VIIALAAPSAASSLWFLTRGTGTVALVLLTVILVLGVLARGGGSLPACPRFVTPAVHRNLSLLAVVLIVVHVVCAVVDPYAPIRLIDAVVPFVSAYRPIWLGLGALTFDLLIAVIVTSLVRVRLGERAWRVVHWAAYACWPIAVAHGLGSGSDARSWWLLAVMAAAAAATVAAVVWRAVGVGSTRNGKRWLVVGATVAVPLALAGFATIGPLAPHWAARAGTPAALLAPSPVAAVAASVGVAQRRSTPAGVRLGVGSFRGHSVVQHRGRDIAVFAGELHGALTGRISITLTGHKAAHGHIELSAGSVVYTKGASKYRGAVASIHRDELSATLTGPGGRITMRAHLSVAKSLDFTGRVTLS
jgi:hypothetical protein